ncbi:MAG: TlyA family RNA methyltransferase [Acidimicrobiia bacterium]|nr:TlyA family RNA methyltransferase [Acidimicrobiia bacterium]
MTRRRLDVEMVRRGLVSSREEAQAAIAAKQVTVAGAVAEKSARMVDPAEPVELLAPPRRFVGRGGEKLAHALEVFGLDVSGYRCLDVGASTGGFTDCLLQAGVARVFAVDVGHGQLADKLRRDPRVVLHEGVNARDLMLDVVEGHTVDLAVVDVSFISLRLVMPAIAGVIGHDAPCVALVKPQFEAPRGKVGKGGVVSDPDVWSSVLTRLAGTLSAQNIYMVGVTPSPITGAAGNVEFLALLRKNAPAGRVDAAAIGEAVATAHERRPPRDSPRPRP